jgi:peptide/nickel transport system permease protein
MTSATEVLDTGVRVADAERVRRPGVLRRLAAEPVGLLALVLFALLVLSAILAPLIAPHSPTEIDARNLFAAPSGTHWLGTDELGRDLFSRVLYGGRIALGIAFGATAVAMVIGVVWGFLSAQAGGWVDEVLMRVVDAVMAIPIVMFALILVAALGTNAVTLGIVIGVLLAPATARIARAGILTELHQDYYDAAVAAGVPKLRILFGEVLPNAAPVLIARAAVNAADAIVLEAGLSFIGLGVTPPDASWGTLLREGYDQIYRTIWYPLVPGVAIFLAIWAFNTLGDRLQDVLDPRSRA